jgi:uncharacterized cupin superfamily protein
MSTMTTEEIRIGELSIRFLIEGDESERLGGAVRVHRARPSEVPVAHSHDAYEETVYGLEGALTWTVDGERREVGSGEALCIRRGTSTTSRTRARRMPECLPPSRLACSARRTSGSSPPSSTRP